MKIQDIQRPFLSLKSSVSIKMSSQTQRAFYLSIFSEWLLVIVLSFYPSVLLTGSIRDSGLQGKCQSLDHRHY